MDKLYILWAGIGLAVLSPMLMGADGCVHVTHHEYINTTRAPGFFPADVGSDHPAVPCDTDPFGLNTALGLQQLHLWLGTGEPGEVPEYAWGSIPSGPATAKLPGGNGWYWGAYYIPSQIEIRGSNFNGPFKAIWYTTQGQWRPFANTPACAPQSYQHCPLLQIKPWINPTSGQNISDAYEILSGYTVPGTGETCLNRWNSWPMGCDYPSGHYGDWAYCWLPSAADPRFPAPDNGELCPPEVCP